MDNKWYYIFVDMFGEEESERVELKKKKGDCVGVFLLVIRRSITDVL